MVRIQVWFENRVTGALHGAHHSVGADHDHPPRGRQRNLDIAQIASPVGRHRLHDVPGESEIARVVRLESGRLVAAPYHDVGGALDFLDFEPVRHLLVPGKIQDAATQFA